MKNLIDMLNNKLNTVKEGYRAQYDIIGTNCEA